MEGDTEMSGEVVTRLMKGNEALALAAIAYGVDSYFGYPITPQSEILETLSAKHPETMTVLQAESEVGAIHMVYGAAACGKVAFTSSSGPGFSLMQGGISYMCGAGLPAVIVNVMRGGPGLGTIQPSQADYYQVVKGGGHGDYHLFVVAPSSPQEMADFPPLAFDWAFRYRNPAVILADGTIGQMMERVSLNIPRHGTFDTTWAADGTLHKRSAYNRISSLRLDPADMEQVTGERFEKYALAEKNDARSEAFAVEDADTLLVAFGSVARVARRACEIAAEEGLRVGLFRPITLWPFPAEALRKAATSARHVVCVELNMGQMIDDVRLSLSSTPLSESVLHYGHTGGITLSPSEIVTFVKTIS